MCHRTARSKEGAPSWAGQGCREDTSTRTTLETRSCAEGSCGARLGGHLGEDPGKGRQPVTPLGRVGPHLQAPSVTTESE